MGACLKLQMFRALQRELKKDFSALNLWPSAVASKD